MFKELVIENTLKFANYVKIGKNSEDLSYHNM